MRIRGGARLPHASSAIVPGASPGLRTFPLYSCLLIRPRAGPVRRRQRERRALGRRGFAQPEMEARGLRAPHFPSLLLPFDTPESWSRPAPPTGTAGTGSTGIGAAGIGVAAVATPPARAQQNSTFPAQQEPRADGATSFAEPRQTQAPSPDRYPEPVPEPFAPEPSAKVIEFPRSAAIPVFHWQVH